MAKKVFILAGEVSGDLLGGPLMQDIKALAPETSFIGIGGEQMTAQGLHSIFPMSDLSVMGVAEVVKHLPILYRRFNQTVKTILEQNPDILITIDAPDFSLRVAKKIKKLRPQIKIIHYVAPTVWAWRPGRAKKIAQFLDGLLCLFPFEPPYFEKHNLKAQFVGHPITKTIPGFTAEQKQKFFADHKLDATKPTLCILPGSRVRELESLSPILLETATRLKKNIPELQIIIPTLPHLKPRLTEFEGLAHVFVPETITDRYLAFASSTVALHASGTVALELALCATPMVTIYKMGAITAWIAKRLLTTAYANLVNILSNYPVVPELIQEAANPDEVTAMTQALLTNETLRGVQQERLIGIREQLEETTSQSAANFILAL